MDISYSEQEELWLSVLNLGLLKLMNDYKILERKDINTLSLMKWLVTRIILNSTYFGCLLPCLLFSR